MRRNPPNGKRAKRRARPGPGSEGGWVAPRADAPCEAPSASHWLAWRRRRPTRIRAGN